MTRGGRNMPIENKPEVGNNVSTSSADTVRPSEFALLAGDPPLREPPVFNRYGCALASVALMTLVRLMFQPALGDKYPFITFYVAIAFTGWYGGLPPAIPSLLCSLIFPTFF